MNIAIFSPNKNPYSETFIQAHKNGLAGKVFYYYGLYYDDIKLETPNQSFRALSLAQRLAHKLTAKPIAEFQKDNLIASLKQNKIQVALVEYGQHAHRLLDLFKTANLPFVVHFHGHDATVMRILKNVNNYDSVFKEATAVIAVSRYMEQLLLDMGCPRKKLHYNVYGPRTEFTKIQAKYSKKQFVQVGRFTNKKAPYYTVLAFNKVLEKFPEAKLIMAGDGFLLEACKNLVQFLNIANAVSFVGVVNATELKQLLEESLAYVQHSITADNGDMEGTPLSILEASAAGLPVISTKHAGIPDVILHEQTGLLCNEHDVATMANHMIKLFKSPDLVKQFGKEAKERMAKNYTLERHLTALNEILNKAAGN